MFSKTKNPVCFIVIGRVLKAFYKHTCNLTVFYDIQDNEKQILHFDSVV